MSSTDNTSPPMAEQGTLANTQSPPDRNKKKRIRNWTADDRAAHRVFERSRREAFKERLTTLASLIPSLQSTDPNRLSKHVVIDQSVALHKVEQQKIVESDQKLHRLVAERDELLSELNTWRLNAGLEILQARVIADDPETASMPITNEVDNAMLRSSISSIGIGEEQGVTGSGPIYLEEPSSFAPTEHELPPEAVLVPAAETEMPPTSTSTSTGIPWMPDEMNFSMPNSIPLNNEFHADELDKSPSYTHLPMTYGMATNNLDGDTLHFNTAMMHVDDPSSFQNDTYIYNG
ncbi:hypothetical protein ACQKWADRAFT_153649 [Trichoderma austrokoningii]